MPGIITTTDGPLTLEDLDFWGTLEELDHSLDDPRWSARALWTGRIRENADSAARLRPLLLVRAALRGQGKSAQTLYTHYKSCPMPAKACSSESLSVTIIRTFSAPGLAYAAQSCRGGLRGYGWTERYL